MTNGEWILPAIAALIAACFFYVLFAVSTAEPHELRPLYDMDIDTYTKYERTADFCLGQFPKTHHKKRVDYYCQFYASCMTDWTKTLLDCGTDARGKAHLEKGEIIDRARDEEQMGNENWREENIEDRDLRW